MTDRAKDAWLFSESEMVAALPLASQIDAAVVACWIAMQIGMTTSPEQARRWFEVRDSFMAALAPPSLVLRAAHASELQGAPPSERTET